MPFYENLNKTVEVLDSETLIGKGLPDYNIFHEMGYISSTSGIEKILQSISAILETPKGTRFFLPEFGSDVKSLLYEPNDFILADMLSYAITDALGRWEKRITVLGVTINADGTDVVKVGIKFKINGMENIYTYEDQFRREENK